MTAFYLLQGDGDLNVLDEMSPTLQYLLAPRPHHV
jgi:hypothetical protein